MGLLIAALAYFLWLTLLWLLNLKPAPYMLWAPVSLLTLPFIANVLVNLFTRRYTYTGNILFHAAFVIILIGMRITLFARFEGTFALTEGESFFGEETEYVQYSASGEFSEAAPGVSFRLDRVTPWFWDDKLHFTRLTSDVRYPATTLEEAATIRLNGGLKMDGARLRIMSFGYAPEVLVEDLEGRIVRRWAAKMSVFPPGSEDHIEIGSYRIGIKVLPDPVEEEGKLGNKSMNLRDPVFLVNVTWLFEPVFAGVLKRGEKVVIGNLRISFPGIKYWVRYGVVKDPGEPVVIAGLVILVLGLMMRLIPGLYAMEEPVKRREE